MLDYIVTEQNKTRQNTDNNNITQTVQVSLGGSWSSYTTIITCSS